MYSENLVWQLASFSPASTARARMAGIELRLESGTGAAAKLIGVDNNTI